MKKKRLNIVYEDKYIIVVNKESGLLTISNDKVKDNTLYHMVREYLNKKNQKAFIVHRLDKDTSGLVLFAKSEKIKYLFQNNWDKVKREYIAIVNGKIPKKKDTLISNLKETKTLLTYSNKKIPPDNLSDGFKKFLFAEILIVGYDTEQNYCRAH